MEPPGGINRDCLGEGLKAETGLVMSDRHVSAAWPPGLAWALHIRIGHVLTAGLLARLFVFAVLPDQHFGDARVYVETGHALATTGFMSSPIYMPLYPLWTWIWGGAWGVKFGDILVSTATIWLVWRLADILVGDRLVALAAAVITAFYPFFLFFAVSGLTETLFTFLLLAAFLCFYRGRFLGGSTILVLTVLVRPAIDFLAPVLIAAFALAVHRSSIRQTAYRVGQYACVYLVLMTPWWVDNYLNYGTFVRLDLGAGIVMYSGNNPLNTSGGGVAGAMKTSDFDASEFKSITDPVQRNAALEKAALDFIQRDPGRFIQLAGVKFLRFWRLWPYAGEYESPWIIAASVLSYGVLLAFSIVYLARQGRQNIRLLSPILLLALYLTLVNMVTIGSIRYRFPLEPFIVILGAAGASLGGRAVARRAGSPPSH
jgi:4-amino-4-deoxy-L-arabinose transferase-like glycosyltransferase